jgi:hypothetical protein
VRPRQRIEVRTHDRTVEDVEVDGLRVSGGDYWVRIKRR